MCIVVFSCLMVAGCMHRLDTVWCCPKPGTLTLARNRLVICPLSLSLSFHLLNVLFILFSMRPDAGHVIASQIQFSTYLTNLTRKKIINVHYYEWQKSFSARQQTAIIVGPPKNQTTILFYKVLIFFEKRRLNRILVDHQLPTMFQCPLTISPLIDHFGHLDPSFFAIIIRYLDTNKQKRKQKLAFF